MSDIRSAIEQARRKISSHSGRRALNEQNTKGALIEPMLRTLGWDIEDPDEVTREYKGKRRDKPVDYALRVMRSPRLFVEAKALGSNLEDRKWAGQIMGYASVAGVKWAVLTDGNEYRIYNTHAPVDVEHKLFRTVTLNEDGADAAARTLQLLSRSQMEENRIDALWSIHFVDQNVRGAIEQLFDDDPNPSLVRLLAKHTTGLSSRDIKDSLKRLRMNLDFPAVAIPPQVPSTPSTSQTRSRRRAPAGAPMKSTGPATLRSLIDSGAIKPPLDLENTYKGQRIRACIKADGTISFEGNKYDTLSAAGGEAKRVVSKAKEPLATNGWSFWQYRTAEGSLESLADLRSRHQS